jgi:hypothetical protein
LVLSFLLCHLSLTLLYSSFLPTTILPLLVAVSMVTCSQHTPVSAASLCICCRMLQGAGQLGVELCPREEHHQD